MKKNIRSLVFITADVVGLTLSLLLAYFIRYDFDFTAIQKDFIKSLPALCFVSVALKVLVFILFRVYKSLWRYAGSYEVFNVILALGFVNAGLSTFLVLQYQFSGSLWAPRSIFALAFLVDVFAVGGIRFLYRFIKQFQQGTTVDADKVKRVLIVGAGDAGAMIAREIKRRPELHLKLVAFYDKDDFKIGYKLNGVKVLGNKIKLEDIIKKERIQEVIIALPHAKPQELNRIYSESAKAGCSVKILPSVTQIIDEEVVMQKVKDVSIEDLLGRDLVKLDTEEIESFLNGKVVLVTGAGGSIGSELCRQISIYRPQKLIMLDNYENNLHEVVLEISQKHPDIEFAPVIANIREEDRIIKLFNTLNPDIVFHAAAHKHVPLMEYHPEEALKNNVLGTWNVAQAAHQSGVKRFVLISSDKAVNPTNVMGATKRIAEMIIQSLDTISKTEFVAVRFGNVLGSNGSVIPLFKKQIEAGGPVTVTHPDMTRYFMAIPEAAQLVIQAGAFAKGGEIFILDMGQPVKIIDLAENMIRLSGYEPYEDIDIKFIGLRPGEKLYEELLLSEEGIMRTKNEKIFVVEPLIDDYNYIQGQIDSLRQIIDKGTSDSEIKSFIKALVPTYNAKTDN